MIGRNVIAAVVLSQLVAATARSEVSSRESAWNVLPVFGGGYVQNVAIAPSNPSRWYAYVDVGGPYLAMPLARR